MSSAGSAAASIDLSAVRSARMGPANITTLHVTETSPSAVVRVAPASVKKSAPSTAARAPAAHAKRSAKLRRAGGALKMSCAAAKHATNATPATFTLMMLGSRCARPYTVHVRKFASMPMSGAVEMCASEPFFAPA